MKEKFEKDSFSGKPKILFVGLAESTHTLAWVDLLKHAELNVRLFALPSGIPPHTWRVKTHITMLTAERLDPAVRKRVYPPGRVGRLFAKSFAYFVPSYPARELARVIRHWKPDIIHTLGLYDNQGGMFYYKVRQAYRLEGYGKWVIQLRGGSDLTLRRHDQKYKDEIRQVLMSCHQIISDNRINVQYANILGVPEEKFAHIVPVPGTGGVDVGALSKSTVLPSKRERIVLWPKAYEVAWSKAVPVLDAIQQAWDRISPCEFHILAMTPEIRIWFMALPDEIKLHCKVHERVPRSQVLELMQRARVLLAPSLIDGIPNILYEAMACGALPIVSPLETIQSVVNHEENVLFARNLYPEEIGDALARAMTDDSLVDGVAQRNLALVRKIADRSVLAPRVVDYYLSLVE